MPFFNDLANNPSELEQPAISEDELVRVVDIFKSSIQDNMYDIDSILKIEPFASNKERTKRILNDLELL